MLIYFAMPPTPAARNGNTVTAERWRAFFESLGHRVALGGATGEPYDVLVAFHASRTREAVLEASGRSPRPAISICLTGTDLYQDLREDPGVEEILALADALVVLQPEALRELPAPLREKAAVIYQSAVAAVTDRARSSETFDVCVVAHLRDVKDPLRAAAAARLLPRESRIRIVHVGRALSEEYARAAEREARENPRFRWLGEQPRERTEEVLATSRLLVLSSVLEGGANVISEAVVAGVPILCTDIPCTRALLGEDYPGFFPIGDTARLAGLLERAENDPGFYGELAERCAREAHKFAPSLELAGLGALLDRLRPPLPAK